MSTLAFLDPHLVELLAKVGVALLVLLLNSVMVALQRHPMQAGPLRQLTGRLSFLRYSDSPGTLHLPGSPQPRPGALTRMRPPPLPPLAGLLLLVLTSSGCVGLAATERTLAQALQTQAAAVGEFVAWDAKHQLELVRRSRTRAEAEQQLADYRTARAHLVDLLKQGAKALEAAATGLQQGLPPAAGGQQ